jgi:DNA-binding MarR family transcriptional regulator
MHRTIWAVKRAHFKTWAWTRGVLRKFNVTPAQFDALFVLSERGVMMQSKLQKALGVVRSTVSELLRDLERAQLVARGTRFRSGRDVKLTAAGKKVVDRAWASQGDVEDEVTKAFGSLWSAKTFLKQVLVERFCRHLWRAAKAPGFARVYRWLPYDD